MLPGVSLRRLEAATTSEWHVERALRRHAERACYNVLMEPNSNDVWYREGLRFECTRCGKCCVGEPGVVWVNEEEITAIAAFLQEDRDEFEALYTRPVGLRRSLREKAGGACVLFDHDVGCTVYPVRPRQCRTWPFWESNLRTAETWQQTEAVCPGSGQGELIPVEEITRRLRVIRL